ncbi:hypothetical protein EVAR_47471_1 [Eumeta japonica]|uniref:Uncharacterized protein n=1 Tax=Eumeta variegata TaxID=151549 RepID=A0A4C1XC06_EUMVA|nr:hypothetical protein EVAR_47471_1 [Eumeta japonica]
MVKQKPIGSPSFVSLAGGGAAPQHVPLSYEPRSRLYCYELVAARYVTFQGLKKQPFKGGQRLYFYEGRLRFDSKKDSHPLRVAAPKSEATVRSGREGARQRRLAGGGRPAN